MGLCFSLIKTRRHHHHHRKIPITSPSPSDLFFPHPHQLSIPITSQDPEEEEEIDPPQICPILGKPYIDLTTLYDLDKELSRGQFGITYLCTEKSTGLKYACKSISRKKLVNKKDIEDVRREILMLQHLTGQPNIVELKGAHEDMHHLHLVMELCSGGELFDRITKRGSYSEMEAARIGRQIVNVVHVCHFMGVMPRDLKPENFLHASPDEDSPWKSCYIFNER